MVKRCMCEFNAPISRHSWCQNWCCDVSNHLASRKLNWRTAKEKLTGETPNISVFRFHFWQEIEYFDHGVKQPSDGWLPGRFLGIAWDSGDSMTYYIETESSGRGRESVLTRSTVRSRFIPTDHVFPINPSGEEHSDDLNKIAENEALILDEQPPTLNEDQENYNAFQNEVEVEDVHEKQDDSTENWNDEGLEIDDQ